MAFPPLPDPIPTYLPPGFVACPDHALEGRSVPISTGPTTPVSGPRTNRMRQYFPQASIREAIESGPAIRVLVSYASAHSPEWLSGLQGERVEIPGADAYYRSTNDQISLIIVHRRWIVEVIATGVSRSTTLQVARSLALF